MNVLLFCIKEAEIGINLKSKNTKYKLGAIAYADIWPLFSKNVKLPKSKALLMNDVKNSTWNFLKNQILWLLTLRSKMKILH